MRSRWRPGEDFVDGGPKTDSRQGCGEPDATMTPGPKEAGVLPLPAADLQSVTIAGKPGLHHLAVA